jgi:hypothetical protein
VTDARLAPSFLDHPVIEALSSDAFRVYVNAIVYTVDKGLDGLVPKRALRLLHPDGTTQKQVRDLVDAGLWLPAGEDFTIRNLLRYQTPAAQVEQEKENARLRKRKSREAALLREKEKLAAAVTRDGTRDVPRESHRTPPRTGTGTGQAQDSKNGTTPEQADWPDVAVPGAGLRAVNQ